MERANMDEKYYLNEKNGRLWSSSGIGNFYIDNNERLDDDYLYNDSSISLPGQYEINEYKIMTDLLTKLKITK